MQKALFVLLSALAAVGCSATATAHSAPAPSGRAPTHVAATEPPPVANGCLQHHAPCGSGVTLGKRYPFEIDVHCGVTNAGFDGRLWRADPPLIDGGNPPPGWDSPYQAGTMTLTAPDQAEFVADTADGPRTVRFASPPPGWQLGDCE